MSAYAIDFLPGAETILVAIDVEQAHIFEQLSAGGCHALDEALVGDVLVDDERDVHRHRGERGHVDVVARRTSRALERLKVELEGDDGGRRIVGRHGERMELAHPAKRRAAREHLGSAAGLQLRRLVGRQAP